MAIHARSSISTFILIAIVLFLGVFQNLFAQQLIHFPVTTGFEGERISLEAKFDNLSQRIIYVRIYYRLKGFQDYQYVEMDEGTDNFVGFIPANEVKAPKIEYFVLALLSNQSIVSSPARNPFYAPYEVSIAQRAKTSSEFSERKAPSKKKIHSAGGTSITSLILSPEPGSSVAEDEVVIAVSFLAEQGGIDKKSIRLYVDDKNVTADADITALMVSYVPKYIAPGRHHIKLTSKNAEGHALDPIEWNFQVGTIKQIQKQKKEKLPISARLFFDAKNEQYSGNSLSTTNVGGNFSGKYSGIHYRGSLFVTSREQTDQQPRNRYLLDVGTSWIGVRFGDTNPRFNDLILYGKRVRGIEAYLKLGFFNIEYVHGETNRAIKSKLDSLKIIPTINDTVEVYKYGSFKQTLLGIRPSFGSGKNFQLGFNLLKVKDDTSSIKYGISPKDNVVFGPDILFALDNHRIEFKAGAAFSLTTNDISGGSIKKSEIDSIFETEIPVDPSDYEDLFVLNTSTTPLDPTQLTSLAYNAQFKFNYFNNSILVQYKSIGSEYNSLGNTFLRNNIQGLSFSDAIRLFKNQLILNIGYDQFIDKLDNENDDDEFTVPTDLTTMNIGISYYPRQVGLPKVNINFKDHNRDNGLDTLNAIGNQTQDFSVHLGYDINLFDLKHNISLGIIGSDRIDDFNPNQSNVVADIRMFTLQTKYQIPLTTTLTYATNQSKMGKSVNTYSFQYNQLGINAIYMLLNNKLKLNGGLFITSAEGLKPVNGILEKYTDYQRLAFRFGGSFQITAKQYLLVDSSIIKFEDKLASSYSDSIFRLRYEIRY